MSLVCCRKTAERLIDFEAKERLIALLNPMENMLCTRKGIDTGSESKPTGGPAFRKVEDQEQMLIFAHPDR